MKCPHGREVEGKDVYGIFSHYHSDDLSSCDVLNVIGFSVQQVLPFFAKKFADTPAFRAAFLVSEKVRKDVYKSLSRLDEKTLVAALHVMYKIVHGAAYETAIWNECLETFGITFGANIRVVVGADIIGPISNHAPLLPMLDLQTKRVADARNEGQRTVDEWRRKAEAATQEAANTKKWGKR